MSVTYVPVTVKESHYFLRTREEWTCHDVIRRNPMIGTAIAQIMIKP
jgi:hypothetical protein